MFLLPTHITCTAYYPASGAAVSLSAFLSLGTGLHRKEFCAYNRARNCIPFVVCLFLKQSFPRLSHGVDVRVKHTAGKPTLHIVFHYFLCLTDGVDIREKHTTGMPTLHNRFHKGNISHTPHNITMGCLCTPKGSLVICTVSDDDHFHFDSDCMEGSFAF